MLIERMVDPDGVPPELFRVRAALLVADASST
jgi:hypothetical protein